MRIRLAFIRLFKNLASDVKSLLQHRTELHKINDPRRKRIYEPVKLSAEQEAAVTRLFRTQYGEKIPPFLAQALYRLYGKL